MPTIGERIDALLGTKPADKPGEGDPTAEQLVDMTTKAVVANLKERGMLVDKPTGGSNEPANQGGDATTWDNIDFSTEAGVKAFDEFMASEAGQKRYTIPSS